MQRSKFKRRIKMKIIKCTLIGILFAGLVSVFYIACSSGGSGGGDDNSPTQPTSEAELDQETVDKTIGFVDDLLPFCSLDSSISSSLKTMNSAIELGKDYSDQLKLARASNRQFETQAEDSDDTVLDGNCGGTLTLSYTENESTGVITGSVVLDNLCLELDGETEPTQFNANGTLAISGSVQEIDPENNRTELNLSTSAGGITFSDGETDFSIVLDEAGLIITERDDGIDLSFTLSQLVIEEATQSGTNTYTLQDVSIGLSMTDLGNDENRVVLTVDSLTVQEETQEGTRTYSLEDVTIVITDDASGSELSMSGTYIDSQEGAVTVSTPTPLEINESGEVTAGAVLIEGAGGTSVLLTVTGTNSFDIQADTDGDGAYDYQPGDMDCSDLDLGSLL